MLVVDFFTLCLVQSSPVLALPVRASRVVIFVVGRREFRRCVLRRDQAGSGLGLSGTIESSLSGSTASVIDGSGSSSGVASVDVTSAGRM